MNEQDFPLYFGQTIKKYRMIKGLTQDELSEQIDLDRKTIVHIEQGETDPKLSTIVLLSQGLETSCSRLFRDTEKTTENTLAAAIDYDYRRLFEYCRELSPEQYNLILNAAHLYAKCNPELSWKKR